jgi:hypothetical protein
VESQGESTVLQASNKILRSLVSQCLCYAAYETFVFDLSSAAADAAANVVQDAAAAVHRLQVLLLLLPAHSTLSAGSGQSTAR